MRPRLISCALLACTVCTMLGAQQPSLPTLQQAAAIGAGKKALAAHQYVEAREIFSGVLQAQPNSIPAKLGLADSELGLDHYETAEAMYRRIVALQPELWQAHKNLIVVEAALGRWEDFDSEREVLKLARERGAPGISARESDVIDSFTVDGSRWVVRQYFEPVGRSQTRYNFEHFSPDGKAAEYISLDGATPVAAAGDQVAIGAPSAGDASSEYTLNWFTGKAHGRIKTYSAHEPTYETVRADVRRWLLKQAH